LKAIHGQDGPVTASPMPPMGGLLLVLAVVMLTLTLVLLLLHPTFGS
jgi:hypothetical protein